jgi:Dethiobiotin synthetase
MSLLFKHLRIHQIFGANTDVGKTILSTALVRASASKNNTVFYLKPVSTGPEQSADDEYFIYMILSSSHWSFYFRHVKRHAGTTKDLVHTQCLYRFQEPVSPHLAARRACNGDENKVSVQCMICSCTPYFLWRSHRTKYLETPSPNTFENALRVQCDRLICMWKPPEVRFNVLVLSNHKYSGRWTLQG